MLMIAGGGLLALMRFWMAIRPPKVVVVSAHAAISIAALGAAALAHSASRMASASLGATTPGAPQLLACGAGAGGCTCVNEAEPYPDRPKVWRKLLQSEARKTSVSSISTMVWPCPETPALKTGFKL